MDVDTDAEKWEAVMRGVRVWISPDIIAQYLGLPRLVRAYLAAKPTMALRFEKIFLLMTGRDHDLIQSSMQ